MFYSWSLFRPFGINIFDFAETNDFLLVAFKEPFALMQGVFAALYVVVAFYFTKKFRHWRSKFPTKFLHSFFLVLEIMAKAPVWFLIPFIVMYMILPAQFAASKTAERIRTSSDFSVAVSFRSGPTGSVSKQLPSPLSLIGTTEKFAFFYAQTQERVFAVPISNIVSVEFLSPQSQQTPDIPETPDTPEPSSTE
jgi:hypothetical protein